jgi:D-threonate/D-erythronate kinase
MAHPPMVILADDLTGAADTAAAFGPGAAVLLDAVLLDTADADDLSRAPVVAVDTNSRHVPAAHAAETVTQHLLRAADSGAALYKKVDSTLRGNIAAEVGAILGALPGSRPATALFAPAFPATGRTVVDGRLLVDGKPFSSARHGGEVRALFAEEQLAAANVPLDVVRQGVDGLAARYRALRAGGVRVICCDAQTEADLVTVWQLTEALDGTVLPVGSAGLARVAATRFAPPERPRQPLRTPARAGGSVLTVLGSRSAVARRQYEALAAAPDVHPVMLAEPFGHDEQRAAHGSLRAALRAGDAVVVPHPDHPVRPDHAAEVAAALGTVAAETLSGRSEPLAGLIVAGGETARAVLLAAGARTLAIQGELEPGVVYATVPGLAGLPLVTKAGAFGDPGTLDRARRALHERGAAPLDHPLETLG